MMVLLFVIILLIGTACQSAEAEALPTRVDLPPLTLTATPSDTATITASPTATITSTPTITDTPIPTDTPTATPIIIPTLAQTATLVPLPTPIPRRDLPERFVFGQSIQGRDLLAQRIGNGGTLILLVGGIHGGWESNTVTLVEELVAYFETTPEALLPGMSLLFVPSLNPDGLAMGQTLSGRFNANNVDLNRNWGCGWEPVAVFQNQQVSPGIGPFSEPETLALAALINDVRPAVVLFYHSAANGVFAGNCPGSGVSEPMAAVVGRATDYAYGQPFNAYPVTGTAPSWVDSLGIPSADVELATSASSEFDRNLRGVMALQCWLLGAGTTAVPACNEFRIEG